MVEDRVKPYGNWSGGIGENLTYGAQSARERLLTWLIDDGFATRGHRIRIMNSNYNVAGLSCGPHPEYGAMCDLTLAGGFTETTAKSGGPTKIDSTTSTSAISTQATKTVNANTAAKPANANATSNSNTSTTAKPRRL
jgi:hypothetical protein